MPVQEIDSGLGEALGPGGALARAVPGFQFRREQLAMADAVAAAIDAGGVLLTEAGTGTGKTFAYLVPALQSGRKVIVSTGTRNLQDQLYQRDLPRLREVLALPAKTALLKGRANYLCLHRLDNAAADPRARAPGVLDVLVRIRGWAHRTRRGDVAELADIPEDMPVWPLVTSTADNCLGTECPQYEACFLVEARRRAQEADLLVVNHHLMCADFALKEEGFGELLPAADCVIVDEAHQLPDIANQFFGASLSARQLQDLARDTEAEYHAEAGDQPALVEATASLDRAVRDFRLLCGIEERRGTWSELDELFDLEQGVGRIGERLGALEAVLQSMAGRARGLDACLARCQELSARLGLVGADDEAGTSVRWFETSRLGFRLNRTPLDIAEPFRNQMARHAASWVFTSATLAVGDSFAHFQRQLGLQEARTARWDSPFDYPSQGLWYVPRGMPDPRQPGYTAAVVERAVPVIEASGGRTFMLFTSHRALQEAARSLAGRFAFPLLVQGSAPRTELLDRFRMLGNAVLLGTGSFWEGVDVPGDALSCVIIDKLPFAAPGDPVLQARLDAVRAGGGNPFMDYQVPQAVIAMKQGSGRLIRARGDRGVLMTCDPRMLSKPYGRVFLGAMPAFARTRELDDVVAFFASSPHESRCH